MYFVHLLTPSLTKEAKKLVCRRFPMGEKIPQRKMWTGVGECEQFSFCKAASTQNGIFNGKFSVDILISKV